MRILLDQASKKYKHDTIFRNLSLQLNKGDRLGISGPNGSGKSTLLKIISGQTSLTKGTRTYFSENGNAIEEELVFYSSGMKQRAKILLALCFESEVVLLDEPSTNLDKEGVSWTKALIETYLNERTLIIASNEANDFDLIHNQLDIRDYKNF